MTPASDSMQSNNNTTNKNKNKKILAKTLQIEGFLRIEQIVWNL